MISVGEGDSIDKETRYRSVLVKMSDGNIHAGKVNIHGFPRLSDFIKDKNDEFIVLVPYDEDSHVNALMLNKRYIIEVKQAAESKE